MSNSVKTIILWVVLIVLFVAFYQVFQHAPSDGAAPEPVSERTGHAESAWSSVVLQWLPIVFLFLFFVFFLRALQKRHAASHEGARLLNQGRYLQALEYFDKYRREQSKQPAGPFNTGVARLQLWKLDEALNDLEAAVRLTNKRQPEELAALLPEHQALTLALLGRAAEARQKLAAVPAGTGDPGRQALTEAILLARAGDAAGARTKLGIFEVKQLGGTVGALARTLDALCIEQLTAERRHVDRVALYGEASPDGLKRAWPELVAFVERAPAW